MGGGLLPDGSGGPLIDHETGKRLSATLHVAGGTFLGEPHGTKGAPSKPGTDAYDVFDGVLDSGGVLSYPGPNVVLSFGNLDPVLVYEIVLFANRDSGSYTDRRTRMILAGAESFVNESSPGVTKSTTTMTGDTSTLVAGFNTETGYVVRYSQIRCGADGAMRITIPNEEVDPSFKFYLNALMLRATRESR